MATSRKIQAEVDRTLKKIQEGIEIFDDLWEKVHEAQTQLQKERHEGELKKEIKKLQRLREQIKTWQLSSDIKDKQSINDARRLIESKMEAFKVCERETKTKAFSKEGLALPSRTDPMEQAKSHTVSWINQCIQSLGDLIAEIEVEAEMSNSRRKSSKSPSVTSDTHLERHQWHMLKLEQILRMIDNGEIQPADVDDIREDIEEYVQSRGDPQEIEEESIYDSLDLPDIDTLGLSPIASCFSKKELPVEEEVSKEKKVPKEEKKKEVHPKKELTVETHYQPAVVKTLAEPISGTAKIPRDVKAIAKNPSEQSVLKPAIARSPHEEPLTVEDALLSDSQLLEISYQNIPFPSVCEFRALHHARNPVQTPSNFPQLPFEALNSYAISSKLELDTLFFIFYYESGTYRQYLAIVELNKRGWKLDEATNQWKMNESTWEWENSWGVVKC